MTEITMTVAKLLELVQGLRLEDPVYFTVGDGCCGDTIALELAEEPELFTYKSKTVDEKCLVFLFKHLPGYRSCIQSGGTKKKDKEYWEKFGGPTRGME